MASKAKRIVVPVTAADPQTKATREACRDCELYKMCCPRCSHVYFRLNYEDKGCPKCRSLGESVWGIRVAGGHFEVDQTIYDILERMQQEKKREHNAKRTKIPTCRK
jgi:hypothetical protein